MMKLAHKERSISNGKLNGWRATSSSGTGAYTLVELIITIVIIAVLASTLATAISSLSERARATQCMSNLRQLYIALRHYVVEHQNTLPPFREYFPQPDGSIVNGTSWRGLLIPYLPDIPFDNRKGRNSIDNCPTGWAPGASIPFTYYYAMTADSVSATRKNCNAISAHARYFVLGDSTGVMRITSSKNSEELAFRHRGKVHLLFLDGHVEERRPEEIPPTSQEKSPAYKEFWTGES